MSIEGKVHTLLEPLHTEENMARNELIKKLKQNTFGLRPKFLPFKGWNDDSSENGEQR